MLRDGEMRYGISLFFFIFLPYRSEAFYLFFFRARILLEGFYSRLRLMMGSLESVPEEKIGEIEMTHFHSRIPFFSNPSAFLLLLSSRMQTVQNAHWKEFQLPKKGTGKRNRNYGRKNGYLRNARDAYLNSPSHFPPTLIPPTTKNGKR